MLLYWLLSDKENTATGRVFLFKSSAVNSLLTADTSIRGTPVHSLGLVRSFNVLIWLSVRWTLLLQRAKKVVSDSPGLVDFAIRLVNSVFNLPDGQVMFFEEFE